MVKITPLDSGSTHVQLAADSELTWLVAPTPFISEAVVKFFPDEIGILTTASFYKRLNRKL